MPWHTDSPGSQGCESPVLCMHEYLTGPKPSGGPVGATAHQVGSLGVNSSHTEQQTSQGIFSFSLFLHLPLPCKHSPRKFSIPRREGRIRKSLLRDFLHRLNLCAVKTSTAKPLPFPKGF